MQRTETLELLIILNLVITLGAVFYIMNPSPGYFGAISIAFINNAIVHSNGKLLLYASVETSTISGDQVYMYLVHALGGVSFDTMMRIPLNHALTAFGLFWLGRELTKTRLNASETSIAATAAFVFLVNWTYVVEDMSFFVKGAGTFLFVVFVCMLLKYLSARRTSTLVALIILFVANGFFDYTAQVWMITFVIPLLFVGARKSSAGKNARFWNLFVLMSVIFLAYRSIVYTVYLPWIGQLLIGSSIASFVHTLPLFRDVTAYPFQSNSPSTPVVFVANAFKFLVTATIVGSFLLRVLWRKARKGLLSVEELIFLALFVPLPITIAIYLPIGAFNLSYAILILPLLSAFCIWISTGDHNRPLHKSLIWPGGVKSNRRLTVLLIALVVSSGVSYVASVEGGTLLTNSNSDLSPGANWLFQHTSGRVSVLSDINSLGKVLIARSLFPGVPFGNLSIRVYSQDLYVSLIRPNYTDSPRLGNYSSAPTYVVVDAISSSPAASTDWRAFEPLSRHILEIQSNAQLSQVYDDGTCLIEVWYLGQG